MPKLVSLKRDHGRDAYPMYEDEKYPYGTRLHLDEDVVKSLGASGAKVGDTVQVVGVATVKSVSARMEGDDGEVGTRLELQITDMGLEKESNVAEKAAKLYPSNSGD